MPPPFIYVINLATAHERRAFMQDQLDSLGLTYEFFDGVHGASQPDHPLFSKYNDAERARRRGPGVSLNLGQLGCFASHYLLWERCVALDQPIIVLEDDAHLQPSFMQFYREAAAFSSTYGLVWLQPDLSKKRRDIRIGKQGAFVVKKLLKGATGTTGYLISPPQARRLLAYSQEWIYPVDIAMKRFFEHKVEAIGIEPVCIRAKDGLGSFINEGAGKVKRTVQDTLRRELSSLADSLRRSCHNLWFRLGWGRN